MSDSIRSLGMLFGGLALLATVHAAELAPTPPNTTLDLQVDASRPAPNDLVMASAYFEASDAKATELARKVNATVAEALKTAAAYPSVKVRSGGTYTYPVYAPKGSRIEAWRMRSEVLLETQDLPALSELLGKLQDTLAISGISFMPSPETRHKASDQAALAAIAAFNARAQLLAGAMGKNYRIVHLNVSPGNPVGVRPVARMASSLMSSEAAQVPAEAGESKVTVQVSGTIELKD